MASRGLLSGLDGALSAPWADQYNSLRLSATRFLSQGHYGRPRPRPTRVIFAVATFFFFLFLFMRTPPEPEVNHWLQYPSYHPYHQKPEDSTISSPSQTLNLNDTLPSEPAKSNPSFHLVLPATRSNPGLCRTLTSAMILNYPPPTLVRYGRELPAGSAGHDYMVDRITGIYNFLAYTPRLRDDDIVLVVDGFDIFFQLPPEVLINRYQALLRETNAKLKERYGMVTVDRPFRKDGVETLQKYSQRVLFSASKECFHNLTEDPGCRSVPYSTLPPDSYGWKTDLKGELTRPRWLKPGAVIGQAADLKLIYAQVLRFVEEHRDTEGDFLALTQMYGKQEWVRELERRRTASGWKETLYRWIGISEATNMTGIPPTLEPGQRYEYGIGVDFESRLFFNTANAKDDVEWLRYNNVTKTSSAQMEHRVPRESRLLLPDDVSNQLLGNPFKQPHYNKNEYINPPWNETLDKLPAHHSWNTIPLMTNMHSAQVPTLVHMNPKDKAMTRDTWWSKMWYAPWARALLRKYMRSQTGFDAAQNALLGQTFWDARGGVGGVWTDKGEWIDYPEVCSGFERDLFDDNFGGFGEEDGGEYGGAVYNQWGNLVKGREF
ncbi:glycosyltransferase domain-containing protein [Aspergillus stella-maris]|uniref:glycosyltransferase domain-containing protein n=1 Tax=Aspergillus stella-maris TaxID=1810926 RepID=UPI003CCD0F31